MTFDIRRPFSDPYPATVSSTEALDLFDLWFDEAKQSEVNDPNAMGLATVDSAGRPSLRTVLLKGHDARGFVFYTNFQGRKGRELRAHPQAALLFHWKTRQRQVRIEGAVEVVSDDEANAYYNSRARLSRLGAWASDQSQPLSSRQVLADRVSALEAAHADDAPGAIPRPPHWSGFRVVPQAMEFWQDGEGRLHDRLALAKDGDRWRSQRLYP